MTRTPAAVQPLDAADPYARQAQVNPTLTAERAVWQGLPFETDAGGLAYAMKHPMHRYWILSSHVSSALALAIVLVGCASCRSAQTASPPSVSSNEPSVVMSKRIYRKPPDDELRRKLTPLEYEVTQREGTEPPFENAYWNNHAEGLYVDVATGEPLFSSRDKFDSGTGWPSFTRPVPADHVSARTDESHGMQRTEVRSLVGNSHLGHVFDDGPAPSHKRYCINSAALRFIPVDRLDAEGYGEYRTLFENAANPSRASTTNSP